MPQTILTIKVTPKSGKHEVSDTMQNGILKVKLKSAPENNKANEELIKLLSEYFGVKKHDIEILKGAKGKLKTVAIMMNYPAAS